MELTGLTAFVTGSNRGIGRAISEELASRPLGLLLCGVRSEGASRPRLRPVAHGRSGPWRLDLSTRESIESAAAALPPWTCS